ncbi:hypothetical protein H2200_001049 [Cladophialophora chaetospira]|uniref:Cytochrome P450 n=1 Tax=Cladophialophora chaetospira TaxID=386627 RepID=A0AA38XKY0_9EURO|nr:hypothetical protein H2200_001049 [Cladophialophora chaetospira]
MAAINSILHAGQTQSWYLLLLILPLAYLATVVIYRIYFHPLSRYPGPFLGKISEFYSFLGVWRNDRTISQYRMLQKYGSPVRFSSNELVFSDVKSVSEIYGQSSLLPEKERTVSEALSATGQPNVLNIVDRHQHGRVRRLLSHGFSLNGLLESESLVAAKVDQYVDLVFRQNENTIEGSGSSRLNEKTVDIYRKSHELYLDIISQLGFARSFDCLNGDNTTALDDVDAFGLVVPAQAFFPGFRYLPIPAIRQGFERVARLERFARKCLNDYIQGSSGRAGGGGYDPRKHTSILSSMLNAQDTESGTNLSMEEIVENTIIFLVAGSSTTAVTLTYLVWECGRRPEVMKKLVEEIRSTFPSNGEMPSYREASKLEYLNHVIDETLRVHGPLNTGVPRISTGRNIGGHYLPAGAGVSNNPYATARDAAVFPEPELFQPERWENATAEMRLMSRPFSIGPRNCIGRHLAMMGLVLTVTRLFQQFDLHVHPSVTEESMRLRDRGVYTPWGESLLVVATPVEKG